MEALSSTAGSSSGKSDGLVGAANRGGFPPFALLRMGQQDLWGRDETSARIVANPSVMFQLILQRLIRELLNSCTQ
jgi:hypothetical protein